MADRNLAQLEHALEVLTTRVATLEEAKSEVERKAEIVQAAQRSWRPLMRVQGDLMIASEAGDTARVPLSVCRALAAGKALDVDVEHDGDVVRLVDHAGRMVASLPRAALLALPRVLTSSETTRLLGLGVQSSVGRQSGQSKT